MDLSFGLEGKNVIVTGGAGAIGSAVSEGFASAGALVAVVDLNADLSRAKASSLGPDHIGIGADLSDITAFPDLVSEIEIRLGGVDVLVNVAGVILRNDDVLSVTEAEFDTQMAVNLKAPFFLSQTVAKTMIARDKGGAIINYSSQGWMSGGFGGSVVYNAGKGGISTMTRGLARSWAGVGIRVNAVAPGLVETPMLGLDRMTPEQVDRIVNDIPMKRLAVPEDHVGATLFLACDHSAYMTGATINVSGGFLMY